MNQDHIEHDPKASEKRESFDLGRRCITEAETSKTSLGLYGPPELLAQREFATLCPGLAINISYLPAPLARAGDVDDDVGYRFPMAHGYPWLFPGHGIGFGSGLPLPFWPAISHFLSLRRHTSTCPADRPRAGGNRLRKRSPAKFNARKLILVNIWLRLGFVEAREGDQARF